MAEKTFVDGIQLGIDTFTEKLDVAAIRLEHAFVDEPRDRELIALLRGELRAYADVVGGLKTDRERHMDSTLQTPAGSRISTDRFGLSLQVDAAIERAADLQERVSTSNERDAAEHAIDEASLKFARA